MPITSQDACWSELKLKVASSSSFVSGSLKFWLAILTVLIPLKSPLTVPNLANAFALTNSPNLDTGSIA